MLQPSRCQRFCRALLAGLLLLPLGALGAPVFAEPTTQAEQLPFTCAELNAAKGTDGSYYSTVTVKGGTGCTLQTQSPAYGIYLEWHQAPGAYTISYDAQTVTVNDGCLHQYIPLTGCTSVRLIPAADTALAEWSLWSAGERPQQLQCWEPPLTRADLLVFPTHADDELLMFGGTLPYYAGECKLAVQVAYLTNHWAETARPHELLNGLWQTGVRAYPIISPFPDIKSLSLEGAKRTYDENAVLGYQVEVIRRVKPSVIISHDINGEYGHGAHMLNAHLLQKAVVSCGDATQYPDSAATYGTWSVQKLYLHLWKEHSIVMDWERKLSAFGGITAKEAAALGYSHHKSQHRWGYSVNYEGVWDCRRFGLYHSTVGYDTTADFMEHIQTVAAEIAATATTTTETTTMTTTTESIPPVTQIAAVATTAPVIAPARNGSATASVWLLLGSLAVGLILVLWLWIGTRVTHHARRRDGG